MNKVVVIHSDDAARTAIGAMLEQENFSPIWASDIQTGLNSARMLSPGLLLLDLPVAGISDIELCSKIRDARIRTPVIALMPTNDEVERILILEMGADDCMMKPFSTRELLARMRAVLRRSNPWAERTICFGDVEIEPERRVVTRKGQEVKLTPCEYNLLLYFVHNSDRPLTRDAVLNAVWGYEAYPNTRTVDAHVVKLRSKFEELPAKPRHFLTIHGVGYRFAV